VSTKEFLTLLEALQKHVCRPQHRRLLLPVARLPGEGRVELRQVRPGLRRVLQGRHRLPGLEAEMPRGLAAPDGQEAPDARGEGQAAGARLGQADGGVQQAPAGAEGAPCRRQQVDRHRRHQPLRRPRLPPRGHPRRRRVGRQPHGGQGLGEARVPQPRRLGRAGHPQHQGRAAPPAPLRPRGRGRGTRPRRHHRADRAQRRLARHPDAPGAPQRGQGAAVPRHRRLDGRPHPRLRGAVLGGRAEFKHLEYFYFHNCVYDHVWRDNRRRHSASARRCGT
jgi:hypothetical protein